MSGQLVEQWPLKKLSEVIEIQNGFAFSSREYTEEGHFLIRIGNVQDGELNLNKPKYVSLDSKSSKFELSEGDLLTSLTGNIGRVARVEKSHLPAALNQRVARMKVSDASLINSEFLYYFLISDGFRNTLTASGHGTAQKNVSTKAIGEIEIPIPPLKEQQRIVSILDEAFDTLEIANLSAQDGITNVQRLFDSQFNQLFSVKEGKGTRYSMSEICSITSVLVDPKEEDFQGLLHVGGANIVTKSGKLIKLKTAEEEGLKSGKFVFDNHMVLYSKIRPYLMKVARPDFKGLCSADIYPLTSNEEIITRDYLFYLLLSPDFTHFAIQGSARAGMPKVNRKHLFSYETILPTLEVQNRVTRSLDELAGRIENMYSVSSQKIQAITELRQSILQEAFNGTL